MIRHSSKISKIGFDDTGAVDAFGRLRTSQPYGLWDNKNTLGRNEDHWEEVTSGGASISYLSNESAVQLSTGTASGDKAIRQTSRYHPYIPGNSQRIFLTGILGASKANVEQRIGYFDDLNGLFFEQTENGANVTVRTSTSGSVVNTPINQSSWNIDTMDGSGPSGVTIDWEKAQIFVIDFQWLGVGRVRFGLDIDGDLYYVHQIENANTVTAVYMGSPTLPVRYEIENIGIAASATSIKEICSSVASEGGYTLPGVAFQQGNGVTTRSVTARAPIFAIRLKTSFNGKENRRTARALNLDIYADTNDIYYELAHVKDPSSVTATWTSVGGDSAVEYSTDISAVTATHNHTFEAGYVNSSIGNRSVAVTEQTDARNYHNYLSQNYDSTVSQLFVVYATSFTLTANVSASLSWIEFD